MLLQIAIALDQLGNTLIPGGWADETISSRAYRRSATSAAWRRVRRTLDWTALRVFRQADHCRQAWLNEIRRSQEPPAIRDAGASGITARRN
jgi:hypothetical protein